MKRLAVIPARGGSKRLKNKNVLPLAGKPLVAYTIQTAIDTKLFDKIVLSTDSNEIANVGREMGIDIYYRPAATASDTATVLEALLELMTAFKNKSETYDVICQMLPTCLFRKTEHVLSGMKMLTKDIDSVVGVSAYDFPITKALAEKGGLIEPFWPDSPLISGRTRTQDQPVFYHDNGAFYITWWKVMEKNRNFFKGRVKGIEIHPLNAVDIDNQIDFIRAQLLLNYMKTNPENNPLEEWLSHLR